MRVGHKKLAFLGITHLHIVEVGERYHRGAAHAAGDHTLAYLADDIVRVDGAQAAPLACKNSFARKREQGAERFRAACLPAHRLQSRACRANLRKVECNVRAGVPCGEAERERIAPALF